MEKPYLLHVLTPEPQASPFDINMAYDAGYNAVTPYSNVTLAQVANLVQDAIFSRGPKGVKRTGILLGGRDLEIALDMFKAARKAMVPPFEVSVFVDPSGAFTTAAAMVAKVERVLLGLGRRGLDGTRILILGGTGPVGTAAAIIAALEGAQVTLASSSSLARAQAAAQLCQSRYSATVSAAHAGDSASLRGLLAQADVLLATAKAGAEVASADDLISAGRLLVAADVNAVPPGGIAGLGVMDNAKLLASGSGKTLGIGALAIGNVKYQVESGLFNSMLTAEKALYIDFLAAFKLAREIVAA